MTTYKPSDQAWSWFFVFTGVLTILVCKHFGIPTDIGAGIIGAGLQAFTHIKDADKGDNGDQSPKS